MNRSIVLSLLALMLVAALLATACMPNRMYRRDSIVEAEDHAIAFIEFDDQGDLWSPAQVSNALARIEKANEHPQGAIVVVFIHGWHHNASPKDEGGKKGNILGFRQLLQETVDAARDLDPGWDRPVVGVYVGWRGESSRWPLLKTLTFFNRASAAGRIARTSATETLLKVIYAGKRNPASKTVLIGHSFGGQIMERSFLQTIVGGVLGEGNRKVEIPADAVILVNPASQAIYAKQLVEALERARVKVYRTDNQGNRYERPILVSVTSEGDYATRLMFPAGLTLKAIGKRFRKYDEEFCAPLPPQRAFYRKTSGHLLSLHSHEVTAQPLEEDGGEASRALEGAFMGYRSEFDPVTRQRVFTFDGEEHRFTIRKRLRAFNDTPYWIMRVPRSLIPDHASIFGPNTVRLIGAILAITGALQPDTTTTLVREDGARPTGLVAFPDGDLVFADRTRGVYRIEPGEPEPEFLSCFPQSSAPSERIGFALYEDAALTARNRVAEEGKVREYRTDFVISRLVEGVLEHKVINHSTGTNRFAAATFDPVRKIAYVTAGRPAEIYSVDLTRKKAKPVLWASLDDVDSIGIVHYDPGSDRLYAADGKEGRLYAFAAGAENPSAQLVASGLGWSTAMIHDEARSIFYIADAKNRTIWSLKCGSGSDCEASVFAKSESFATPSSLAVTPDGTVWVGDIDAQAVFGLSPDGRLVQTVDRLPSQ